LHTRARLAITEAEAAESDDPPMFKRTVVSALAAGLLAIPAAAHAAAPTDPQAGSQQPLQIMRVGEALDLAGRPLQDIPVLVADTGLDLDHPDIQPRLFNLPAPVPAPDPDGVGNLGNVPAGTGGWDLIGTTAPPNLQPDADPNHPAGTDAHGTLVAGVLGAAWNNGQGGAGVAPNARFIPLRTCWPADGCYQYVQASAVSWAADRGARVASFSWLVDGNDNIEAGFRDAMKNATNTLFVTIPSGNGFDGDIDGTGPMPCNLDAPNVLCVSTSSPTDGTDCGGYGKNTVDVAVPTQNSVTTANGGGFTPTGCATSFAAPTAAGVATILFGIDPTASPADVKAAIVDSARKVPSWDGKSQSGGIIDAAAAVALFQQRRGIPNGSGQNGTPPPGGTQTPIPPTPPTTPGKDTTAPKLSSLSLKKGKLTLRLDEKAKVTVTVQRQTRNKKRRLVWITVTTSAKSLPKGTSTLTVSAGKKPKRGRYRALVQAKDAAGNKSRTQTVSFSVTK
jgi:hypothetical protein